MPKGLGGTDRQNDGPTNGRLEIPSCVLQDIGPMGPLPKKLNRIRIQLAVKQGWIPDQKNSCLRVGRGSNSYGQGQSCGLWCLQYCHISANLSEATGYHCLVFVYSQNWGQFISDVKWDHSKLPHAIKMMMKREMKLRHEDDIDYQIVFVNRQKERPTNWVGLIIEMSLAKLPIDNKKGLITRWGEL